MIEFNEDTYCLGIWYLQGHRSDWLAAVTRDGNGPLVLRYRFRRYRDGKAFDSDDEKSWWQATCPNGGSEDEIIRVVDGIMNDLIAKGFSVGEPWRAIVRGGAEVALQQLQQAPFIHLRRVDDESPDQN